MKIWKVEVKPGHFSANALALLVVTLGALLLAGYGYETGSMLRLAVVAVITTIFSVLAFRYSQQDIPGLVVSWAAIICAMVVLFVGWMAFTYEVPFPLDTTLGYVLGPLSMVIFYVVFLYAAFFVYHNFIEEEEEEAPAVSPLVSRAGAAAQRRAASEAKAAPAAKRETAKAKPAAKAGARKKAAASGTKTASSKSKEKKAKKKPSPSKKKGSKKQVPG